MKEMSTTLQELLEIRDQRKETDLFFFIDKDFDFQPV